MINYDEKIDTLCNPIDQVDKDFEDKIKSEKLTMAPFILADRGGCSFVTKVRNMEDAGGAVGIVIDSSDEDVKYVAMSDDGTGAGIRMPSMLISKRDGLKIIDFLKTASKEELSTMIIMAKFEMSRPDNRVEYDIWLSSSNDKALDFIQDFGKLDEQFGTDALMTPHYVFWKCENCEKEFTDANCFAGGKYCAQDSSNYKLSGRDIILEDLRQMCIYKQYYQNEGEDLEKRQIWWKYMKSIHQQCYSSVNYDCSDLAHKDVGISIEDTQKCVSDSWNMDIQGSTSLYNSPSLKNSLIDKEVEYEEKYGTSLFPAVVINNQTFRGQLEREAVFNAICSGFETIPDYCKRYIQYNLNNPDLLFMEEEGHSKGTVALICSLIMFVVLIILCLYRRYAKRQMKEQMHTQIEQAVSQYLALSNKDTEAGDRAGRSQQELSNYN